MPAFMKLPMIDGEAYMKIPEIPGEGPEEASVVRGDASYAVAGGDDFTTGDPDPVQVGMLLPAVQAAREAARGDAADDEFVFAASSDRDDVPPDARPDLATAENMSATSGPGAGVIVFQDGTDLFLRFQGDAADGVDWFQGDSLEGVDWFAGHTATADFHDFFHDFF